MPTEQEVAGGEGLAQLRKELQEHRKLLAVIEAAKRGRVETCHVAGPFAVTAAETAMSGSETLDLALGALPLSRNSTLKSSLTQKGLDACVNTLQKPAAWTCHSCVASSSEAAAQRTYSRDSYDYNIAEPRAGHTRLHVQSPPLMPPPIAACARKSAAIRPPWRGTFSRATSAAAPHPSGRDHARHALHQTHYQQTGSLSTPHGAKARPQTATRPRRAADGASSCAWGGDIDADAITHTLGQLAAAAAISVMVQGKPKLLRLPSSAAGNGANKAWCSGQPNRLGLSGSAAVAKGAATGVESTRAASAAAPLEGASTRLRHKTIGAAAPNLQNLFTAHANMNVPAPAASASECPVFEASKDVPGSGQCPASGALAADFGAAIREQQSSCNIQHNVNANNRPSAEPLMITSYQRDASLFIASKGYRTLSGNRPGTCLQATVTPTTAGNTSDMNSDIYVCIDQNPAEVPCQRTPPAFPVLERLLHRRGRRLALFMAHSPRAAPSSNSSQLSEECPRSAHQSAFVSSLCDSGCLSCEQRSDAGQIQAMPGEVNSSRSDKSMTHPIHITSGFEQDKASARPPNGGGQRQSFDSHAHLRNADMPGVSAAAAIRGGPIAAADAYAIMRAWRQRRAAAAAVICRAARRYLDAG
ncbi:hypothetical protein Vretimale_7892 [Volvox reticuliferus]|nr:hypothetical protein Vretifemale_5054 [Volvox reticuliferus]GIM03097.1 hypothetical protein Vretimale_7892 [Volvox reticuliferus]